MKPIFPAVALLFFSLAAYAIEDCPEDLVPLKAPKLMYPEISSTSRAANIQEGYIVAEFLIEPNGTTAEVAIVESYAVSAGTGPDAGAGFFNEAATRWLSRWKYSPRDTRCKDKQRVTFGLAE